VKIGKYQELCKVCDHILMHDASTLQITANNYLHVLNAHPEHLEKYELSKVDKIWLPVRFKLISIVRGLQSVFDKRHYYVKQAHTKSDILFVSHLTNEQQLLNDNDAYFGDLPNQLMGNNVSVSIALINHVKINKRKVLSGWRDSGIHRVVLSSSLGVLAEIKLYFSQNKSKKQFKILLKDLRIEKELAEGALHHHLSPDTFNALRIAKQVRDIIRKTGAKYIITTYEGYAWERIVYYCARKVSPDIKCFGYQHAAVFEYQHAIKRPLSAKYSPDVIFTSGLIAKDIFGKVQLKNSKTVCLGSPKYSAPNLMIDKNQRCCLVVPEIFVKECLSLFGLSRDYAKQSPDQKFIWRLHPVLKFEELRGYSAIFEDLPDNIVLSEGSLEEDIQKCDSVLYRGSTAVVNAINKGLKPIYYQQSSDELGIDPIYTHKKGKSIVHNREDLGLALDQDINAKTIQSLQDFAQDFYTSIDVKALLKEIAR
jgi:hypothetical protein